MNRYLLLPLAALALWACSDKVPTEAGINPGGLRPSLSGQGVYGASFTSTNIGVDGTGHCKNGNPLIDANNCNIYDGKQYVWIEGGPAAAALGDGTYFFAVLIPGGQNNDVNDGQGGGVASNKNLSDNYDTYAARSFSVASGVITNLGTHDFANGRIRLASYATTTNPGGEYDVAVCKYDPATYNPVTSPVTASACKYDNFKVREGLVTLFSTVTVDKFYDANADGARDGSPLEPLIVGWAMTLNELLPSPNATQLTPASWTLLDPGTYSVTEGVPTGPGEAAAWFITYKGASTGLLTDNLLSSQIRLSLATASDLTIGNIVVVAGATQSRLFGNVCLAGGGGLTLGFWSNKNGAALFGSGDLALMVALNLRDAAGSNFDPASYSAFRTWLLSATATNMAYMLSAQLAAMELNVFNGFVNPAALIYAPGTNSANALGFASVGAVMAEANTELGLHGTALAGDAWRSYQEALKIALDNANNNLNFVQSSPCAFTF